MFWRKRDPLTRLEKAVISQDARWIEETGISGRVRVRADDSSRSTDVSIAILLLFPSQIDILVIMTPSGSCHTSSEPGIETLITPDSVYKRHVYNGTVLAVVRETRDGRVEMVGDVHVGDVPFTCYTFQPAPGRINNVYGIPGLDRQADEVRRLVGLLYENVVRGEWSESFWAVVRRVAMLHIRSCDILGVDPVLRRPPASEDMKTRVKWVLDAVTLFANMASS